MKKFLTLCTALLLFGSMTVVHADYYVAGTMNGWNTTEDANKMSLVSGDVYSKTFSAMGATSYEFKISTNSWGTSWGSGAIDDTKGNVTLGGSGNITFTLTTTSDVTFYFDAASTKKIYVQATPVVVPSYTFTSGTLIYYNFTAYGGGINVYAPGAATDWYSSSAEIIPVTLSSNWEITASTNLFKSAASSWNFVTGTKLPTEGQNMIVSTDGATYHWDTYSPAAPSVAFNGVPSEAYLGQEVTFAATSENVTNPTYTYYVKQGAGEYGSAVSSYTFNATGSYTVKVEVRENGAGDALASAEKSITCVKYSLMKNNHTANDKGSEVAVCSTTNGSAFTATWTCPSAGTYYLYVTKNTSSDAHANCDYLNSGQTFEDGVAKTAYLYGDATGCYGHSYTLNAPRAGEYTFTLTLTGVDPAFKCDYPEALDAEVNLDNMPAFAYVNAAWTLADYVGSVNVVQPEYTFYVKKGDAAYGDAVTAYTFEATGEYTIKAEVREQGAGGDALDDIEKTFSVYEPLTLYFVNKNDAWTNIHAFAYLDGGDNIQNKGWTGELMTNTGTESLHGHDVYSITIPNGRYDIIIFNNNNSGEGNQTANLAINAATPYYFDGAWYATLAEADPVVLTTDLYLAGSFNTWSTTANRFMKETEDATEASVSINITEYSNITFKVIDNGNWRGCDPAKTLNKEDRSVTILADASGNDVGLTPYAAGDYIFTINLDSESENYRQLTVAYPDGDPMPIPQNIYLSCDVLNDWAAADPAYKFNVSGNLATLEVTLAEETNYAFKLVYNDAWYGANYDFKYYWCTDVPMTAGETQANLYSFKAGNYTFSYDLSTSKLSIGFQETSATDVVISQYEYATLYSAAAFDVPEAVEAYVISGIEGIKLTMERIYRIPANTGVLLHAPQGTYQFYEGDGRWMDAPASNLLKGSTVNQEIDNELVHYVLSYDLENNVGLYWPYGTGAAQGVGSFTNNAGKAYLEIPALSQPAGVAARRGFPFHPANAPTGLDMIKSQDNVQKLILDGQLFILRDGNLFNAQGARVQ